MNTFTKILENYRYFRFQVFIKHEDSQVMKTVGMAFMKDEHSSYCLKLWSFMNERFYIVPKNGSPREFFIMTRELNRLQNSKTKFHWNIVGSASATSDQLNLELSFDLFEKKIFMSLIPNTHGAKNENTNEKVA